MMVKVDRRRTAGFIVVIVGMLAAQGVTLGANGGQEFVYYYFDQPVGLTLDLDRVAIEELTDGPRRLVRSTPDVLLDVGIPAEALERTQVPGMAKVLVPAQINSEAGIRKLVADLVNTNAFAFVSPVFVDQAGDPVIIRREIFVGFGEAADPVQSQATLMASVTGRIVEANYADMPGVYRVEPDSQNGFDVLALANTLAQRPDVVFAEPDAFRAVHRSFIPNDPFFSQQWDKHNTGGGGGVADVDMNGPEAWDISFGDPAIVVAVLDDGVQQNHPDLNQIGGTDTTGNGTGGDPLNSCDNHGTTVAGCVGAIIDNGVALAGIAPGCKVAGVKWNVSNTPCDGGGTFAISWFVNALTWAQNNADVTNNSNGFGSSSTITNKYDSTRAAGLIHFASSGNGGTGTIGYPSSIGSVNSIGSITRSGARSSFSNWGNGIAFAAPGSAIITTDRTGSDGFVFGDAISANGTSYSSPNASGVAALVLSVDPALTPSEVEQIMQSTAMDLGSGGYDTTFGWGLPRADAAMLAAAPPPVPETIVSVASIQNHGGTDLGLDLLVNPIEPRLNGVERIDVGLTGAVAAVSASVSCANQTYTGTLTATPAGSDVTLTFAPGLADVDCCTVTLSGDAADSFIVQPLRGDVDLNGSVTTGDASQVRFFFNQTAASAGAQWDFDASGTVTTGDFSQIRFFFNNNAPACP